ncbi:MAG: hydroxyacid dehydrogenase [Proteobacteria bacterium]|nr:hydroxyacid dehydrogenase [Pseudomonadota bacterium]
MKKVLVVQPIHDDGLDLLRARDDVAVHEMTQATDQALRLHIVEASAIIVRNRRLDADTLTLARQLEVVSRHGVGFENVDVDALTQRGIPLAVVGDVNAVAVAEHTLYLMLAVSRKGFALDRAVRRGRFAERDEIAATELWRKTVLVVGFGRIGRRVAALCRAFAMTVLVYDPLVAAADIDAAGCRAVAEFRDALGEADFVSLHLPLTDATRNLIGAAELAAMKPTAILINAARGGLVDDGALGRALINGAIAGAGLDTFAQEPPSPDNPLLALANVVLSPHSAALTEECRRRMAIACAQHVLDAFDGTLDPAVVVNPETL